MATWAIPATEPDSNDTFEDQYYETKRERDEMKQTLNELSDENRLLRTKCAQLDAFRKKVANGADAGQSLANLGRPGEIQGIQRDYDDLFRCYSDMQREYRAIAGKHKAALQIVRKQKKEIQSLRLRCSAGVGNGRSRYACRTCKKDSGGCRRKVSDLDTFGATDDKGNVDAAIGRLQHRLSTAEEQLQVLKSHPPSDQGMSAKREGSENQEVPSTKLHMLQAQHQLDESRIRAQAEKLEKILSLHKEYKARHGALKKELHLQQERNEDLEFRIVQLETFEDRAEELANQNRFLEERIQRLCEPDPEEDGRRAEMERRAMELRDALEECERLNEENVELKGDIERMGSRLESAERCFTRQRPAHCAASPAVPSTHARPPGDVWQELERSQRQCSEKEKEAQRAKDMLRDQMEITQKLQVRQAEVERKLGGEIASREKRIDDILFESSRRLSRIRSLESQLERAGPSGELTLKESNSLPSLPTMKNKLGVTVHGAALCGGLPHDCQSCVLVDFFHFGSELSDVSLGTCPTYDIAVTYELEVNPFLVDAMARGEIRFEIYVLREDSDPELFARSAIPSASLFSNPTASVHFPGLELTPAKGGGEVVGSLSASVKLARPMPTPDHPSRTPTGANREVTSHPGVPELSTIGSEQDIRKYACSQFVELLTDVVSALTESEDDEFVDRARLLRFLDPPPGTIETAVTLRRQIYAGGKAMLSKMLSFPPGARIDQHGFRRCIEGARHFGSMPHLPPDEEFGDLFFHLSDNNGQASVQEMDLFVSSVSHGRLAAACQALRRSGCLVRDGVRSIGDQSGKIALQSLGGFVDELFRGIETGELGKCPV